MSASSYLYSSTKKLQHLVELVITLFSRALLIVESWNRLNQMSAQSNINIFEAVRAKMDRAKFFSTSVHSVDLVQ